ncbi:MAG TPA: flippase activity-associated protein Agl23 [Pyrinomonadaceae bacterium]|nr:flippase activity-associated protein Agl23 [Pyrinomonadaceae bacterium]
MTKSKAPIQSLDDSEESVMSRAAWLISCAAIFFVAAVLRLYDLNLVPLHHDEGVNGNFLVRLVREGYYHYDPANYHGPTLYYFSAAFPWLMRFFGGPNAQNHYGLSTVAIRCVPALFGLATVLLVFTLRKNLGTVATLAAAFLLTVSPGAVYLSRYYIHETLFVFFTLGIVVALVKYYELAQPILLVLAMVSAALLFATKETAVISVIVLLLAFVITLAYHAFWRASAGNKNWKTNSGSESFAGFIDKAGGGWLALWVGLSIFAFLVVYILFYSSFRTNPQGIADSLRTFQFWTKTGKEAHVHPPATYIWWLMEQESPLLILGAMGAIVAVLRPSRPMALFVALWAFGLTVAYSLIGYKTPWLQLNFVVPLALSSGVAIGWLFDFLKESEIGRSRRWVAVVAVLLIAIGPLPGVVRIFDQAAYNAAANGLVKGLKDAPFNGTTFIPGAQTIDLNFINYDNDDRYYVYVYAHTRRETQQLVAKIDEIAALTHQGDQTGITIVSPDYWPLPWYLRDYKRVGYHGHMSASNEPIIIAKSDQTQEVEATFGDRYVQVQSGANPAGTFPLRPGVDLLLYTRRELVR